YSAEFMRPGRGRIEIVTKPGGKDYSGTLNFRFRDSDFNARNAFATTKPEEQRRTFEGSFGGPIPNTKATSFQVSGSYAAEDNQSIIYAFTPSGPLNANIATPQLNLPATGPGNHAQGDKHVEALRFSHLHEEYINQGVGGVNLPEVATNHTNREDELTFSEQTILSPRLFSEFRIMVGDEREPRVS